MSRDIDVVYHFAAQVAVTTSAHPREDFEIKRRHVQRARSRPPSCARSHRPVRLDQQGVRRDGNRHDHRGQDAVPLQRSPVRHPRGAAARLPLSVRLLEGRHGQYVRDYARIYDLRTVVLRQSCIYGTGSSASRTRAGSHTSASPRAWATRSPSTATASRRDALWIDDLVDAYRAAAENISRTSGQIYNIGGGPEQTVSIWKEFGPLLERLSGIPPLVTYGDWRPGDQPVYISDIRKAEHELGWKPKVNFEDGVARLWNWVDANVHLFGPDAEREAV